MKQISLCITHWNRVELLLKSFEAVVNDPRIGEVVIWDDASEMLELDRLMTAVSSIKKIKLAVAPTNVGCYRAKRNAIYHATNPYCIILDSDNIIERDYIDAVYSAEWRKDTILQPQFAKPAFNFLEFAGLTIDRSNVAALYKQGQFDCLLNAMNYFVNRDKYLRVWEDCPEPYAADTILQNYNWFSAGNKMFVTPGMEYFHRIHPGSHFVAHESKSRELHKQVVEKIKMLR